MRHLFSHSHCSLLSHQQNDFITYDYTLSDITEGLEKVELKSNYHFSDNQKEFDMYKLEKKTSRIKREFANIFGDLQQHLLDLQREGIIALSVIKTKIKLFDNKLRDAMDRCKSLEDVFEVVSSHEHSSFLDYDLLKLLVDCGNEKLQRKFVNYKMNLQLFFEERLVEQATGEGEKSYVVIIDKSITDEIEDLIHLQNRVKFILGHKNVTLLRWESLNLQSKPYTSPLEGRVSVTSSHNSSISQSTTSTPIVENNGTATLQSSLSATASGSTTFNPASPNNTFTSQISVSSSENTSSTTKFNAVSLADNSEGNSEYHSSLASMSKESMATTQLEKSDVLAITPQSEVLMTSPLENASYQNGSLVTVSESGTSGDASTVPTVNDSSLSGRYFLLWLM